MYENGSGFASAESLPYGRGSKGWGCLIKGDLSDTREDKLRRMLARKVSISKSWQTRNSRQEN